MRNRNEPGRFAAISRLAISRANYQDLVQKAQQMQLPDGTTEKVRKAIAWMHTGGKMGEKQDDELMAEVAVATQATDMDQRRLGMPGWCEAQKTNLAGLIRSKGG